MSTEMDICGGCFAMIGVRKLSPGGYEYLTGSVACADRGLEAGESLSDYYLAHGYPPGQWFGAAAEQLGMAGDVTREQMNALFGEGRRPDADRVQAEMIAVGHTEAEALAATKLGNRFPQFDGTDKLRSAVIDAYKQHNIDQGRPVGAPLDDDTRVRIRRDVQAQAYADAHAGQQPSAAELTGWLAEQKRSMKSATSGFELVFAPPKSVSVAWALADQSARELIVGLHRQAVRDTLTYFQDHVAYTRKGAGGYAQHDVKGIAAAIFEHWDSRAGDPHLHTHVPISVKVQAEGTERWTSLDGRTVLAASVTMSEFYNSRVRDLFRENGATWTERPAGGVDLKRPVWELDGVPSELLTGFSQRASQVEQDRAARIVAFRRKHGREPTPKEVLELSQRAQYGTRDAKQAPRSLAEHLSRWRAQAAQMVPEPVLDTLRQRIFGGTPEPLSELNIAELAAASRLTVSDYYSHFNRWNIEAEAHRQTAHLRVPDGTRDRVIADVVDAVITASDTVALQAPALTEEPNALKRASGESVFVEHNSQRYTTHQTLREEAALTAWGRLTDGHRISPKTVKRTLAGSRLNEGQQRAVAGFATSGRRIQLLYAPAGTGKTTTMKAFAQAWRADGGNVYAFGPSARAAQELGQSIGATPHTLHQVTTALKMGFAERAFPFTRGDVLIIDEIAMSGTRTLHDVVAYALRCGADVRWVGDNKQLAAVEAGGAVRWFAHNNDVLRLHEVVRFADRDQATASLHLREGNAAGLDYYFDQGWVHGGSRETIRDAAHRAWRADLDAGRQTLLIVPTNDDVTALNRQARALRINRGDVEGTGGAVRLHDGTAASAGDWIVTRDNDRLKTLFSGKDFVKNGDTWELVHVRRNGAIKVRHRESRGAIVLPAGYVAEHVELAYASTVNRVQGMSVQGSAHGIVPQGLSREQLYTLATRASDDNHLYPETHQHTIDSHQETPLEQSARAVLETVLTRSSAETSATEELRASLGAAESLRTLVGHHDYVALLDTEERVDAVLTEHAPELLERPAAPALRQTLYSAEALGWQAEHLVPAALASGPLDGNGVDDPAAVLQWRIQQRVLHEQPPERTAAPTMAAINHWRGIVERHDPTAAVEEPAWMPVWQRAAAAATEGLDADAAVTAAARQLAARPDNDPMDAHRFTAQALDATLRQQRADGAGWHPALPWMASPNHIRLATEPEFADYLARLNTTIGSRVTELRATVTAEKPAWTAALGPRPLDDPAAADRWDELATLGAAYRDTYNVTTNDPRHPLGDEPDGHGLKARAWRQLIDQWTPPASSDDTGNGSAEPETEQDDLLDRLRADIDPDEMLAALAADDMVVAEPREDHLADLAHRYGRAVRAAGDYHRDEQIRQVLTERAPQVYGQNAEGALLWALRQAHDLGWSIEQVVPDTDSLRGLDHARDPAAVLYRRVQDRVERADPPHAHQPQHGPLPWLEAADPAALADQPELADHLDRLGHAIIDRAEHLRAEVAAEQPDWTAGLGPRPADPAAAEHWDSIATLAAAYRETYNIQTTNPAVPIGPEPGGHSPRAQAWNQITNQWRPTVTTPGDQLSRNQEAINALRDQVIERGADYQADAEELAADYLDDTHDLRSDARAAEAAEEEHRYDDAEDLDAATDFGSGLNY